MIGRHFETIEQTKTDSGGAVQIISVNHALVFHFGRTNCYLSGRFIDDLLPTYCRIPGCGDTDTYPMLVHFQNGHSNPLLDDDAFPLLSTEYQHEVFSC